MSILRASLAAVHQSDALCLSRFHYEATTTLPSGPAATKGVLLHEIIERYTREQAEHAGVAPMSVVREVLHLHRDDAETTDDVIEDVVNVAASMFGPRSELRFGLGDGTTVPEWRWALDEDFKPIAACAICAAGEMHEVMIDGGMQNVPCSGGGWESMPAYEGTIDRLVFGKRIDVYDWKSTIVRESSDEQADDHQARRYGVAVLAHFAAANEFTWHKVFLRHGYAARHEFKRDEPWHEATKSRMRAARARRLAAIEKDEWPETLGTSCAWCPRLNVCAAMKRAVAEGVVESAPIAEQANTFLAVREWMKPVEARLRAHVAATEAPIELGNDDGEALGLKPVAGATLAISYETAMERLALLLPPDWPQATRDAWFTERFRYVTKSGLAARVKNAAIDLLGRKTAMGLLFSEFDPWLIETTDFEFSTWVPEPRASAPKAMSPEEFDAFVDRMIGG